MSMSEKRIAVIGSYNVGLSCQTDRLPVWGETLLGRSFAETNGGKGANQAVAAARLGGQVAFVGCVGDDRYGQDGLAMLAEEGVDVSTVKQTDAAPTGVGFIFLNEQGENCILVAPGANECLQSSEIENLSIVDQADILVFQLESNLDTVLHGMKIGREQGKTVILNPAPAREEAAELLSYATIVNPNESELLILNGRDPSIELTVDECRTLSLQLLKKGPETVIVTRGDQGALLVTADGKAKGIPAVKAKTVDSTGAGDAFTGALAVALAEDMKLEEAVSFSCAVGGHSVTINGVIPSLPTRQDLISFERGE